jgi:aspartyl-tRNA(Asn)/glutamyl-tRNA(Gln) amidotransferase subunit A
MQAIPNHCYLQSVRLQSGEVRPEALIAMYLERISAENRRIGAVTQTLVSSNPVAGEVDGTGKPVRRPLTGLCVLVKNMIDVAGGNCSGGLAYLRDRVATADAEVVTNLRTAGATILGITASDLGGFGIRTLAVTHPIDSTRIVGGSSGGSAAAVAAGFSPVTLGTDSGGSVRIPAACCGVVGFKPTWDVLSLKGVLPFSPSLDHVGILSESISDIALVMSALSADGRLLSSDIGLAGTRIGVDQAYFLEAQPVVVEAMQTVQTTLSASGVSMMPVSLPSPDTVARVFDPIVTYEAARTHATRLDYTGDFQQAVVSTTLTAGRLVSSHAYETACRQRLGLQHQIDDLLETVDYLLLPTLPCLPPRKTDDHLKLGSKSYPIDAYLRRYTCLFNASRHPVLSIPVLEDSPGVGVSVQLVGRRYQDGRLLEFGKKLQAVLDKRPGRS